MQHPVDSRAAAEQIRPTPATAKAAVAAIPDCAKAAQSGSPGAGDPALGSYSQAEENACS